MPLYEYQCDHCGHRLEALQKMSDDNLVFCPKCDEPGLRKLISAAAFRLKGTGWYETDFKNSGKKEEAKKPADDKPGKSAGNGSDSPAKGGDSTKPASGGNATTKSGKESASSSGSNAST